MASGTGSPDPSSEATELTSPLQVWSSTRSDLSPLYTLHSDGMSREWRQPRGLLTDLTFISTGTFTIGSMEPPTSLLVATARRWILPAALVAAVAVDQLTKTLAVEALGTGPAHVGILHLRLVANRGLLMGMLPAPTVVIVAATLLLAWTAVRAGRRAPLAVSIAFGLLAGGALGNLIDRFLQRQQFPANAVVDWVSFGGMTFNLADVALLIGALILLAAPQEAHHQPAS